MIASGTIIIDGQTYRKGDVIQLSEIRANIPEDSRHTAKEMLYTI